MAEAKAAGKSVVIVESPAKAKTINKILGDDFVVKACMGHVRDLPARKLGIDVDNNFEPTYRDIPTRKKTLQELKSFTRKAPAVYLASDPDREGEAIAWHLAEALAVPAKKLKRVTFNEITKKAVAAAFQKPAEISMDMVNAQQARRILDRIVGYRLSPLLWKKIGKGLSAGRVQSVAVKLIVDREREILAFKKDEYWSIDARLHPADPKKAFLASLKEVEGVTPKKAEGGAKKDILVPNEAAAKGLVDELRGATYTVEGVDKKEKIESPPPPFTTSLLQQQASIRLHFSTKKTMMLAQQLYEGVDLPDEGTVGLITYMRTDSFRISDEAMTEIRSFVKQEFTEKYLEPSPRVTKSKKEAQDAHEAIRPTHVDRRPESLRSVLSPDQWKLYRMIWERAVATQMKSAVYAVTEAQIKAGRARFAARGRELVFDGHTRLTGHTLPEDEQILPALRQGQRLDLLDLHPEQHFTQPPPRFSEATLVKTLEKFGIGRPSTYAPIISTIQDRGYVRKEKRRFHATELGTLVTEKLAAHFADIMDVQFTSRMEEDLDRIEEAHANWVDVVREFYDPFTKDLEKAQAEMASEKDQTPEDAGPCEKCGKPMKVRWSRSGKFLGCSGFPECKNTKSLDTETTDEKCEKCGAAMRIRSGPRGRFLACSAYPECKNTKSLSASGQKLPEIDIPEPCDQCGAKMVPRLGRRGPFIACSAYPKCRNTRSFSKEVLAELKAEHAARKAASEAAGEKVDPEEKAELDDEEG
ncbi:MAG: type I DNA topoisomerase [Planctomycetes bacterium]|nr:type I DNA topoisomerase [Planctomycetota bacterium]